MIEVGGVYSAWASLPQGAATNAKIDMNKEQRTQFINVLDSEIAKKSAAGQPLDDIFSRASQKYEVPEELLKIIGWHESGFTSDATSYAGAMGIMQLMPVTAQTLGVTDAYDPEQNIMAGAKLMSMMLEKYDGDLKLALAAYGAGSGAVDKHNGVPPYKEVEDYVDYVLGRFNTDLLDSGKLDEITQAVQEQDTQDAQSGVISTPNPYYDPNGVYSYMMNNTLKFTKEDYQTFISSYLLNMQMKALNQF